MVIRSVGAALAAAIAAVMLLSVSAAAADPTLSIGYVDVQSVFEGYEKTVKSKADFESLNKQIEQQLQTLDANRLLNETERKQLLDLVAKPNPTDKEKEQTKALQDQERALDAELKDLQSKKEPTDQEKARLKELQDRVTKSEEAVSKLIDDSKAQLAAKGNSLTEEIRNDILKAVEEIAKQKGLGIVVDKIAILYGGVDITKPVIEKLNGKKK